MTDHEGGKVGAHIEHCSRNFLGLAEPTDRLLRLHFLPAFFGSTGYAIDDHRRLDDARADRVHPDVVLDTFKGDRSADTDHRMLDRDIRRLVLDPDHAGAGRRVDDTPAAALLHQRHLILHCQVHAPQIDGDHRRRQRRRASA